MAQQSQSEDVVVWQRQVDAAKAEADAWRQKAAQGEKERGDLNGAMGLLQQQMSALVADKAAADLKWQQQLALSLTERDGADARWRQQLQSAHSDREQTEARLLAQLQAAQADKEGLEGRLRSLQEGYARTRQQGTWVCQSVCLSVCLSVRLPVSLPVWV